VHVGRPMKRCEPENVVNIAGGGGVNTHWRVTSLTDVRQSKTPRHAEPRADVQLPGK
jgi:hypothetical protein